MAHPTETTTNNADRRGALKWLTVLCGALASAALGLPIVGYVLGSFLKKPEERDDQWVKLERLKLAPQDFPKDTTRLTKFDNPHRHPWDGQTGETAVYVRRLGDDQFQVFSVTCAHLGCPVSWFAQSGLFLCPCHGGVYYEDGSRASGPPPRGLFQYEWELRAGQLWIKAGHLPTLENPLDPKDHA